jgi:hypothetical protein
MTQVKEGFDISHRVAVNRFHVLGREAQSDDAIVDIYYLRKLGTCQI